jgi:hypothetical protein
METKRKTSDYQALSGKKHAFEKRANFPWEGFGFIGAPSYISGLFQPAPSL